MSCVLLSCVPLKIQRWLAWVAQTNGFVLSWIPAARIVERSNASALLDGFEAAIRSSVYLNWYHPHGGGGYEDVGAVEAVNSMLLLSIVCPNRSTRASAIG